MKLAQQVKNCLIIAPDNCMKQKGYSLFFNFQCQNYIQKYFQISFIRHKHITSPQIRLESVTFIKLTRISHKHTPSPQIRYAFSYFYKIDSNLPQTYS